MVGSVVVLHDKIIGEGYTSAYGGHHAEVNAIMSVPDKSLLREATLYVTLEPCSHFGKTPPCSDLIIKYKIPKVVIGIIDPHKKVAGKGIKKLKDAGCEVILGVLKKDCIAHHKRFLTFYKKKRPYIILKWAETSDRFIAPEKEIRTENHQPYWITNENSRQLVHQWRSQEHAILVGTNTVIEDNPKLNVRHWKGNSPIRIVVDKTLRIHKKHHIFDKSTKTIVITNEKNNENFLEGIHYEHIDFSKNSVHQICAVLHKLQILSVIVEGGLHTLQSFINTGIWDEARVFTGSTTFKKGIKAPEFIGEPIFSKKIKEDTLTVFKNKSS